MVKLGTQQLARQREFGAGKVTQQVGVKPTQAAVKRRQDTEIAKAKYKKQVAEYKKQVATAKAEQERYLAEKAIYDRRVWLNSQINKMYKSGDWSYSKPKGLSRAEEKEWENASSNLASANVYAGEVVKSYGSPPKPPGTYVSPEGYEMSMREDYAMEKLGEEGGTYFGEEVKYTSPGVTKPTFDFNVIAKEQGVSSAEIKRYEDYGYSTKEATALARESKRVGGMSFSPSYSKGIVQPTWTFKDEPIKYSLYKLGEGYFKSNEFIKEKITYPGFDFVERKTGLDLTTAEAHKYTAGLFPGISAGISEDIKESPVKSAVIYGSSVGLGYIFKGTATGLGLIPKVGKYASPIFKTSTTLGGGYLLGSYAYSSGKIVFEASS